MHPLFKRNLKTTLVALFISAGLFAQETTKSSEEAKVKTVQGYKLSATDRLAPIYVNGYATPSRKNIDPKDLKSKEISTEVNASKAMDVYIENNNRTLEIKTWDQPKVKLVTTIYYEGEEGTKVSDDEWFEKLNITLRATGSSIKIKSGTVGSGSYSINGNSFGWSSSSAGRSDMDAAVRIRPRQGSAIDRCA